MLDVVVSLLHPMIGATNTLVQKRSPGKAKSLPQGNTGWFLETCEKITEGFLVSKE